METPKYKTALIVGAGEGLSASLARLFAREKIKVALAARKIEKLGALCRETGAHAYACNAANAGEVERRVVVRAIREQQLRRELRDEQQQQSRSAGQAPN